MPTPSEYRKRVGRSQWRATRGLLLCLAVAGCGGEPPAREVENARVFEALLTAVSLKNAREVENDAQKIEERHRSGELSDGAYRELSEVLARARAGDWQTAEAKAYAFRKPFGDRGAYFK